MSDIADKWILDSVDENIAPAPKPRRAILPSKGWAIYGKYGFYVGWFLTRKEAIRVHTKELGLSWSACRRNGDRAVKIIISAEKEEVGRT